uniref:Uncharacterized protein n=1 Tax=Arundo donax TaxID=35708 RepID=A0A0A9D1Q7_ARUDO
MAGVRSSSRSRPAPAAEGPYHWHAASKAEVFSSTARRNATTSSAAASSSRSDAITAESFAVAAGSGGVDGLRGPEHILK